MKKTVLLIIAVMLLCTGCGKSAQTKDAASGGETASAQQTTSDTNETTAGVYEEITQNKAKEYMDNKEEPAVILDVSTYEEYNEGHIKGALCIPVDLIKEDSKQMIEQLIPRKDQTILVYCRNGNCSKTAAQALADMGYVNVKEFGEINDWQYGTVTE